MGGAARRAVVAGASGFIGVRLIAQLREGGYEVAVIGRGEKSDAQWGDGPGLEALVDGADLLVNLAGRMSAAAITMRPETRSSLRGWTRPVRCTKRLAGPRIRRSCG